MVHGCAINGRRQPCTSLRERLRSAITFRGLGLRAVSFFRALNTERKEFSECDRIMQPCYAMLSTEDSKET